MRLTEWLHNKALVKSAANLHAKNDTFICMVQCLEEETPLNNPLPPTGATADDRSHRLGLIEGYAQCLRNLKALGTQPPAPRKPIPETYQAEES